MRFGKYDGVKKEKIGICLMSCAIVLVCILFSMSQPVSCMIYPIWLSIILFSITSTRTTFVRLCCAEKAHLSDMIIFDKDEIKLECESGENKAIQWNDVIKIERDRHMNMPNTVTVTGINGEKIFWYIFDKKSEHYIFEQHPELRRVYSSYRKNQKI